MLTHTHTHTHTHTGTRELFPHAPSVPGLGWPRALCLALFRRSLLRNEWKIAEMSSLQLSALSLPPTATMASILNIANDDGATNEFRAMLSNSDSGGGTSCALFVESCFCVVKLMAAREQWERALRTARVLYKVCKSFGTSSHLSLLYWNIINSNNTHTQASKYKLPPCNVRSEKSYLNPHLANPLQHFGPCFELLRCVDV